MQRAFTNILSDKVDETAEFYEDLLGMTRHFSSDWFVILTHADMPGFELGILQKDHAVVPEEAQRACGGSMLTFIVDDISATEATVRRAGATVIEPKRAMDYGQTRMIVKDPAGTLVDLSAPTP